MYLLCGMACDKASLSPPAWLCRNCLQHHCCCCSNYEGLQFLWDKYRDYGFTVGAAHWLVSCCAYCHSAADS